MIQFQLQQILSKHIPEPAAAYASELIVKFKVHLTIKWNRASKLGDYRVPRKGEQHKITVNNALNKYAFLITLIHEIAHLTTFEKFGWKVADHGQEWKQEFKTLMRPLLLMQQVFPPDVHRALVLYMNNPKASSCSDVHLMKTLNQHDAEPKKLVGDLPIGTHFSIRDEKRIFRLDKKMRKNYLCKEINSGLQYRISAVAEVKNIFDAENILSK